jgi:hypothetical protein
MTSGVLPEFLITMAANPWDEIRRVAATHGCERLLLGFNSQSNTQDLKPIEQLFSAIECDVSVLAAPPGWRLDQVHSVLVPIGGRGGHDNLRARLLGSLTRLLNVKITFIRVLPTDTADDVVDQVRRDLKRLCDDKAPGIGVGEVIISNDVSSAIATRATDSDLVILGLQRLARRRRVFSEVSLQVAKASGGATIMISRGD